MYMYIYIYIYLLGVNLERARREKKVHLDLDLYIDNYRYSYFRSRCIYSSKSNDDPAVRRLAAKRAALEQAKREKKVRFDLYIYTDSSSCGRLWCCFSG